MCMGYSPFLTGFHLYKRQLSHLIVFRRLIARSQKVIRRMKSSGSPCLLDKIPILCFKHCTYLHSYLTEIIKVVWQSNNVSCCVKRACTILIHKKGDTNNPTNFRPITLESIPLKVFTPCIRNEIFEFLRAKAIFRRVFVPKLSGTFEHTAQIL